MKKYIAFLSVLALLMSCVAFAASAKTARVEYCEYCQKEVEWTAWTVSNRNLGSVETGHYYLAEDIFGSTQKVAKGTVCLDLNGYTLQSNSRALLSSGKQYTTGTPIINVMDSKGGGYVTSKAGANNPGGGTVVVSYGGEFNLFGGTLQYITTEDSVTTLGGVVRLYGGDAVFNMWGGCVDGSQCQLVEDTKGLIGQYDGCGAAISLDGGCMLNLRGGKVIAGKAEPKAGRGDCVFVQGTKDRIVLAKDAQVDDIWFDADPAASLTVSGVYTGTAQLSSKINQGEGVVIGKATANANISGGTVTYTADSYFVDITEAGVVLTQNPTPNGVAGTETTDSRTEYCEYCKTEVEWTPWKSANASTSSVTTGHYYLAEDISNSAQKIAMGTVCLDLNGHTLQGSKRLLLASGTQYPDGTPIINVMDSEGGGQVVTNDGSNNAGGGTALASGGGIINLYSGTLKYVTVQKSITAFGGVMSVNGEGSALNMYGGCVDASQCQLIENASYSLNGCGAAIACYGKGALNLRGGRVISGKAHENVGRGDCIFVAGITEQITVARDAWIDEIWFDSNPSSSLTISGTYTGSFMINGKFTPEEGLAVSKHTANADISQASIAHSDGVYFVVGSEEGLVLTKLNPKATAIVIDGEKVTSYNDLNEAVAEANGCLIRLNVEVSYDVAVNSDTYLDLNGHSITGKVQVADDKTLYCLDAQTDDYTIEDGVYGKLTNVEGNVAGLPQGTGIVANPYLMHEADGELSFHCMGLKLMSMTLRGEQAGVYYKCAFGGDEIVKDYVKSYGVALSVVAEPTATNINSECRYSRFTDFSAGGHDVDKTSTLLKGIMKTTNSERINLRNVDIPIYGRAYMELNDGTLVFGDSAKRSFKEQIDLVNDMWYDLNIPQRDSAYSLYEQFTSILDSWDIMNIQAYQDTSKDGILKILNISNSHGQDAIWQLPSVLNAEMPDQEYVIVEMYQSYALTEHILAAKNNSPVYHYQVNTGGFWETITKEATLAEGLLSQNWDYIMMNESSRHLGLESKMSQGMVDWFANYIMEHVGHEPKLLYDMTWASPTDDRFYTDSTRQQAPASFKNTYTKDYGFDHVNHYNQLVALTKKYLIGHTAFNEIMFNATPVQYAGEVLGVPQYDENQVYDLYRDYTHISDYARLIVAYNTYCQLFDIEALSEVKVDVIQWQNRAPWNNRHQKLGDITLTEQHKSVLMQSVNHSLKNPLSITAEQ